MAQRGKGFHKSRSLKEDYRRKHFATFVQERRWTLDISQAYIAKCVGVNQSQISRIEQGLHLPRDRYTLERYADVLELEDLDRIELFQRAGFVFDSPLGLADANLLVDELVGFANDMVETAYQARMENKPQRTIQLSQVTSERLRAALIKSSSLKFPQFLLRTRGLALLEQVIAYNEILMPQENFVVTKPIIDEIRAIAKQGEDEELFGLADFLLGNNYYLVGRYDISIQLTTKAIDKVRNTDDKIWLLRGMALDWAYLKEEKEFLKVEAKARSLIEEGRFTKVERVCEIFAALGRSRGLLHLPKTFERFEEGWNVYALMDEKEEGTATRFLQLVSGELQVMPSLEQRDKQVLEDYGKKGLHFAKQHGYLRYAIQIEKLLEETLG